MVLVKRISLMLAVANLFSTYFEAAQSLAEDHKTLLVKKLDIEKTHLLIWGNTVGLQKVEYSERVSDLRDHAIKAIFSDTEKLERRMGSKLQPQRGASILVSIHSVEMVCMSYKHPGDTFSFSMQLRLEGIVSAKTK